MARRIGRGVRPPPTGSGGLIVRRMVFIVCAVGVSLALATAVSPWASNAPDGLNKVAADQRFLDHERMADVQRHAPAAGYAIPGLGAGRGATAAAGLAGTLLVLAAGTGMALLVVRRGADRS